MLKNNNMDENKNSIDQLLEKLEVLMKRQESFSKEINELRREIYKINISEKQQVVEEQENNNYFEEENQTINPEKQTFFNRQQQYQTFSKKTNKTTFPKISVDLEKFVGENLISKLGIVITVIGVAIGAKYSIDHQLISPLTRIILGYLMGIGLLGFGFKLKKNYENYSAVLVSGAMAIMYFITFAAYSFYGIMSQSITFVLMVVFTVFTVIAAIKYNKQVIAHIGLVGAYAVPFLLSDGSGKVVVLFSYMSIINIGILVIAFRKYWKSLYYSSFALTWIIYLSWYGSKYSLTEHFSLAILFSVTFFIVFYTIFLAYKLLRNEKYEILDVIMLLSNSFLFYGVGYTLLADHSVYQQMLGLFTIINALIHFAVSIIIYKQKLSDRNLLYLVSGLVLIFITIAIPVQLDGNWVTLLWVGEAALLFWIGRTRNIPFYEKLSFPLMLLAFLGILIDWKINYSTQIDKLNIMIPLFNVNFLSSLLFIGSFGFINIVNQNKNFSQAYQNKRDLSVIINFCMPAILLFVIYASFFIEIAGYFNRMLDNEVYRHSSSVSYSISELQKFKTIWLINYSLLFLTLLSFVNIKMIKMSKLGAINLVLNVFVILVFLLDGLYKLSELRESYLEQTINGFSNGNVFTIGIRYISFALLAALFMAIYQYIRQEFIKERYMLAFDILLYLTIIWIVSSELINWMDIAHSTQSYKLGLSILWGTYSLLMIVLGIWKKKKHLRFGAIALFAVTLLKLFLYDISYLDTISKTIVFVSLGILLLIISFLYNKYKNFITGEDGK